MNALLSGFRVRASYAVGHRLVRPRPDDRYIVSYPRSGSTWLRTILVNLLQPDAASNPDVFNALIPGISIRRAGRINALPSPRLIKSHTGYRRGLPAVVYLVRDGRDALVSLYHYRITRRGLADRVSFPKFFDRYCRCGYGLRWDQHVESWMGPQRRAADGRLMIVHFEDMKADTEAAVGEITRFLGLSASAGQIREAVRAASLERVREIERSRRGEMADPNMSFYRGGQTGQWKAAMTPAMEARFDALSADALRLAGYSV